MNRDELQKRLQDEILVFDGGFGSELYRKGFFLNTSYDGLCLNNPGIVAAIHEAYITAGCDVLTTNSYNANARKLAAFGLAEQTEAINLAAVAIAKKACAGKNKMLIAGSLGPLEGNLSREEASRYLLQQALALQKGGADFLIFESLSSQEDFLRILPLLSQLSIAWIPSFVVDADGCLSDGTELTGLLKSLPEKTPPAALGLNCGKGPDITLEALQKCHSASPFPWIIQPGAGNPRNVDNRFMPMTTPEYFTTYALRYTTLGARAVGGCCGIGPDHIADLVRSLKPLQKTEHAAVFEINSQKESAPLLSPVPLAEKSAFGAKLAKGQWVKLIEMLPPRGYDLSEVLANARLCKEAGFDAINLPDGPRAGCRLSQVITAIELQEKVGIETIIHCCSRDRNLISLQSMILGCMAKNLRNILFITGDPPKLGDYPFSSGVFDVDSIGMLKLQQGLNQGVDIAGKPLGADVKTAIVAGAGADPNAIDQEREFRRLEEKIKAGAEFIITQPIFEPAVLKAFLKRIRPLGCPVIAGVWPFASYRNALFMKKEVPGVIVPDWIMRRMEQAEDKEAQKETGIAIARQIIEEIHDDVQGIATSAPLGRVQTAIEVCNGL